MRDAGCRCLCLACVQSATAATTEFQVTLNVETNARHAAAKMGDGATAKQLLLYGKVRLRMRATSCDRSAGYGAKRRPAKRARRLLHSALTRRRMKGAKRQAGLCISLLRRELAHAQRPKFSGGRASRAALRASPSRSVATCSHRFCRLDYKPRSIDSITTPTYLLPSLSLVSRCLLGAYLIGLSWRRAAQGLRRRACGAACGLRRRAPWPKSAKMHDTRHFHS
jgi:hypothetical protein